MMSDALRHILIVLVPLILTNIFHMLVVKQNYFSSLRVPISIHAFGKNKTWRGFVFVPVVNALILLPVNSSFHLNVASPILLGFILGTAYMLFELPNSFLKRRLGVEPGGQHNKFKILFSLLDKMDSALGVALTYFLLGYVNYKFAVFLFFLSILTHILFSQLLVSLKVKKNF